jgi:citrate synthase
MPAPREVHTAIATADATSIRVGGRDLVNDLIGEVGFTAMLFFLTARRMPTRAETQVLDACLVTLMEHGLTPSAVIARLMADSVPEEPQVAIAAGLLAIGSVFAGTTEQCAALLVDLQRRRAGGEVDAVAAEARARAQARRPVPGFGHPTHRPDDPRAPRLLAIARREGVAGDFVALLEELAVEVDAAFGRHVTINATGAIAALLLEIGIPIEAMRGCSVAARAGGLVGHWLEEKRAPSGRAIWNAAKAAVPYRPPESDPTADAGKAATTVAPK